MGCLYLYQSFLQVNILDFLMSAKYLNFDQTPLTLINKIKKG